MPDIMVVENKHDVYFCKGCDQSFQYAEPTKGFKFLVGSESGVRFDDDNDFFIAGDTKVIVGKSCYGCHNEEYPCFLDEGDWINVVCEMLVCTCGEEFTFDNDYCTAHGYSTKDDAMRAAKICLAKHDKSTIKVDDEKPAPLKYGQVSIGDKVRVKVTGADGSGWYENDVVEVTEINSNRRWVRGTNVTSPMGGQIGASWNIRYESIEMVEAKIPDDLADKFKPKSAEKKVTAVDF